MTARWDETWHRLREWTNGQAQSERLAAQILVEEGYKDLDPIHPLGGKDGRKDATCEKDGKKWLMAVYFPSGQQPFSQIKKKFLGDLDGVGPNSADGLAFVTNQKLTQGERKTLKKSAGKGYIELFHLERVTAILDKPGMSSVRKQFLGVDCKEWPNIKIRFHQVFSRYSKAGPFLRELPIFNNLLPEDYAYSKICIDIENTGLVQAKNIKLTLYPQEFERGVSISPKEKHVTANFYSSYSYLNFEFSNLNRDERRICADWFHINFSNGAMNY